jgi:flagellar basal body-associated protein FliL
LYNREEKNANARDKFPSSLFFSLLLLLLLLLVVVVVGGGGGVSFVVLRKELEKV